MQNSFWRRFFGWFIKSKRFYMCGCLSLHLSWWETSISVLIWGERFWLFVVILVQVLHSYTGVLHSRVKKKMFTTNYTTLRCVSAHTYETCTLNNVSNIILGDLWLHFSQCFKHCLKTVIYTYHWFSVLVLANFYIEVDVFLESELHFWPKHKLFKVIFNIQKCFVNHRETQ